uniref:BHLH domain-containing protein n=1 Tax=Hanusia phi TaxID=3032 RepID=A0A7S0F5I2_9CRYP|mmetsp:Transcript_36849/g.83092  ORF Transcript_36849/g.83092 Transcript_36849/m.83092 type:complete len:435 (+) Transcript_36849:264-1568(+)
MPINGYMSAAEVLIGCPPPKNGLAPWGMKAPQPTPPTIVPYKAQTTPAPPPSISIKPAEPPVQSSELVATAAGALLGLQNEQSRMSHKQVEQHRRLKAKQFFDELRCLVPAARDPKNDRNKVLHMAIEYLKALKSGQSAWQLSQLRLQEQSRREDASCDMIFEMEPENDKIKPAEGEDKSKNLDLTETEKRLSHNEVEQRRRFQAKILYDELRSLIPNSNKYDKNTVLFYTIQTIKQLSGVSEESLAKMVQDLGNSETEIDEEQKLSGIAHDLHSDKSLPVSESPTDIASFAETLWGSGQRRGHKRSNAVIKEEPESDGNGEDLEKGSELSAGEQASTEKKRIRRLSEDSSASLKGSQPTSRVASSSGKGESDDDGDCMNALSLLSECALQVHGSAPSTPVQRPRESSWGETSLLKALPTMRLSVSEGRGQHAR